MKRSEEPPVSTTVTRIRKRLSVITDHVTFKKVIKPLLQLLVTGIALYVVLKKSDFNKLTAIIRAADPFFLMLALFFFNLSKLFNALRLNRYLHTIGIRLSTMYNIRLYYLGMFYNLFLPGGIGGDGYKIYLLQKNHGVKMINIFSAVLWDRIGGMFALIFLSLLLLLQSSFALHFPALVPWTWIALAAIYPALYLLNKFLYPQFLPVFTITAVDSALVQVSQTVSAYFVLQAVAVGTNHLDYLAIFLLSTIATILPFTIGGAGAREITFFYLLGIIRLDTAPGIALALIVFGMTVISSIAGVLVRMQHEKTVPEAS